MPEKKSAAGPSAQLLWQALELSHEAIVLVSGQDDAILWHNNAFQIASGSKGELLGKPLAEIFPPQLEDTNACLPTGWRCLKEGELRLIILAGPPRVEPADQLTGLADRGQFERYFASLWTQSQSSTGQPLALLFIDLNGFKQINDASGHLQGDQALRQVAHRLQAALRADDFLARFGGDEFVVLLTPWQRPEDVSAVVERMHDALRPPLQLGDQNVAISASIGIAYSTDGHDSPDALLHAADRAMYAAKKSP